jgi:hypothetical protein
MREEELEQLKLDLIEIVNPIGEVLEEVEAKFEEAKQKLKINSGGRSVWRRSTYDHGTELGSTKDFDVPL